MASVMNVSDYKVEYDKAIKHNLYTGKISDIKKQAFEKFLVREEIYHDINNFDDYVCKLLEVGPSLNTKITFF